MNFDTIQDFLCDLGKKQHMYSTLETVIFTLNHLIVRPTKIIKGTDRNWPKF